MPPDDTARKRAFFTYGPTILRTLVDHQAESISARALFDLVRRRSGQKGDFHDFELALSEAFEQRYVEVAGKDPVYGDVAYAITRYGLSVAPPGA